MGVFLKDRGFHFGVKSTPWTGASSLLLDCVVFWGGFFVCLFFIWEKESISGGGVWRGRRRGRLLAKQGSQWSARLGSIPGPRDGTPGPLDRGLSIHCLPWLPCTQSPLCTVLFLHKRNKGHLGFLKHLATSKTKWPNLEPNRNKSQTWRFQLSLAAMWVWQLLSHYAKLVCKYLIELWY